MFTVVVEAFLKTYFKIACSNKLQRWRLLTDLTCEQGTWITDNKDRRYRVPPNFPARFHPSDVLEYRPNKKVCNLCVEEDYDPSHFNNLVERFPFDNNHVPSLQMIKELCESVHSWLSSDPKNTVVIHCMAGKGRTGLMVSSYLTYTGMLAEEALQVYADKRTTNNLGFGHVLVKDDVRYNIHMLIGELREFSNAKLTNFLHIILWLSLSTDY
ncbi:phosphatidylinositol 3,4,5-trisphosphate 3-phosphatase and protein-tyrosine-phosphatase PTEN1 [Tanacetum coccineum]